MSIRGTRVSEYKGSQNGLRGLSDNLARAAAASLLAALNERGPFTHCETDNHRCDNALGAIILMVTALDSLLNEVIACDVPPATPDRELGDKDTRERFKFLVPNAAPALVEDVRLVVDVRNEIVHYLPREIPNNLPSWFGRLEKLGLLIFDNTYELCDRLLSYKLAYWLFESVERAAQAVQKEHPGYWGALAFAEYRKVGVYAPEKLGDYDALRHGEAVRDPIT